MKKQLLTASLALLVCATFGQQPTATQLRKQLAQAPHDTVRIRLYRELARQYMLSAQTDSIIYWADKGLALVRTYKLPILEVRLTANKAYAYKLQGDYIRAQAYFQQALQLVKSCNDMSLHSGVLFNLATVYGDQGMYDKVIDASTRSLALARQSRDTTLIQNNLQLLSLAYLDEHDLPQALSYAQQHVALSALWARQRPDRAENLLYAQTTLAEVYEAQGQYAKAYPLWIKALNFYIAKKDRVQLPEAVIKAGQNLIHQKRPQQALTLLEEAAQKGWANTISNAKAYTDEIYAQAYQQLGQQALALQYAQSAYTHARALGHLKQIQATLNTLLSLEENQQLYRPALAHLRQLMTINDSLFTHDKSKTIARLETQYRVKENEQTIQLLQKEASLKKVTLERNRQEMAIQQQRQWMLIIFIAVLITVAIGLFLIFRRARAVSRLLAKQKADIEQKADQLQEVNALKDKLFGILGHDLRSPVASLKTQLIGVQEGYVSPTDFMQRTNQLVQSVDNVYVTLDNLLHWSMLQRDKLRAHLYESDLSEQAEMVVRLLRGECQTKQLTLATYYQPAPANLDEHQIQIVIRNLLHNAIKFTPSGGHISVTTDSNDDSVWLTIRDSGVGIALDNFPSPATNRQSSRGTAGEKGTGLGLAICREFIKLNKGLFTIESTQGKGTSVTIRFPHFQA